MADFSEFDPIAAAIAAIVGLLTLVMVFFGLSSWEKVSMLIKVSFVVLSFPVTYFVTLWAKDR